jgi:threonine aldolase
MDKIHFGSDNVSGIAPEILAALAAANDGGVGSYGDDALSHGLERRFAEVFETEVSLLPVGTGSIANCLALALVTPPWGDVFCSDEAHIVVDEANGPGLFTGGARLTTVPSRDGRMALDDIRRAATRFPVDDVHNPMRAALSITQTTETGTLYGLDEVRALGALARELGIAFHMDGARFANAVAALGCSPAELTWKAGVDVLSFGGTKNGCLAVEAIVLFGSLREQFPRLQRLHKRAGQLYSKMRFFSAQLDAYLAEGNWLRWAGHANAQAARLAAGLAAIDGITLRYPVEANEVFLRLPMRVCEAWTAAGIGLFAATPAGDGAATIRLVASFATDPADVDRVVEIARSA